VKYFIDYQHMPAGASRPLDNGNVVPIEANDKNGLVILPDVGDYVHIEFVRGGVEGFSGKVRSRLFRYFADGEEKKEKIETTCTVNIVVEETNDDWGKLIKE
jgi:hypothetical protein